MRLAVIVPLLGTTQTPPRRVAADGPGPVSPAAVAVRALRPPVIDGRDDDPVWQQATPITAFREWQPRDDGAPQLPTEARVAYDAANVYVFVRAFDPHPDSIITRLARRDTWTPGDRIWVLFDGYHDRRNGYEFAVTPSGVKIDGAWYDDGREDLAWDAVWDVATRIDSLGWTAEFRIPLSQLRYTPERNHTFGFLLIRDIYRYNERVSWPHISRAHAGVVSQFGDLTGLDDIEPPRRMEVAPYGVAKNATKITNNTFGQAQSLALGGDLKYQVASNLTLDATINPDFGQVEADPAVLNLTAYETFFDERRPFFVAGRGLFRFAVNCSQVNCNNEGLFYSRRIGRTPQLASTYNDTTPQPPTPILGAAKLLGRLPGGLTLGLLEATTARSATPGDTTIEPLSNYAAIRLRQDLRGGESSIGAIATAVNRNLDAWSAPYLHRDAYVGAVDVRHRFPGGQYEASGTLDLSRVAGSKAAITSTSEDAVHYYQRPDAGLALDSSKTSLVGDAEEVRVGKVGGRHILGETSYQRRSLGFEINDLGYLQRADQQTWSTWIGWFDRQPRRLYQSVQWNFNWVQKWTAEGLPEERGANSNIHFQLNNLWWVNAGGTIGQLGTTYCYACARGGPAVRQDPFFAPWAGFSMDDRRRVVPQFWINYNRNDQGRTRSYNLNPVLDARVSRRLGTSISLSYTRNRNDLQWFNNYTDLAGASHYTFAHLEQQTVGLTLRLDYTIAPTTTLQVYAQPFISKGTYSNIRELANPRAMAFADRYRSYGDTSVTNNPGGFNFKELQSNVVFRWEYRPGSTLFLVWNQGRQGSDSVEGATSYPGDLRGLFRLHPSNTFLVKVSYWLTH